MKLVDITTGNEIKPGARVKTFRGEDVTVLGFAAPRHSGSEGRVTVTRNVATQPQEYYPSVINAKIVEG